MPFARKDFCGEFMQTSGFNDTTLHEIGDLDREISAFYTKKASLDSRPKSLIQKSEPFESTEDKTRTK